MGFSRVRAAWACGVVCALVTWACSQGDHKPPYIPDPSPTDSGQKDTGGGGDSSQNTCTGADGGCNALLNCGNKIYLNEVASDPPAPTGGTVPDGTYVLTDYTVFTGPNGTAGPLKVYFVETMRLTTLATDASATQDMEWLDITATNSATNVSSSGTASFSQTKLSILKSCPSSNAPFDSNFSVNGTDLLLFVADTSGTGQLTFTKM